MPEALTSQGGVLLFSCTSIVNSKSLHLRALHHSLQGSRLMLNKPGEIEATKMGSSPSPSLLPFYHFGMPKHVFRLLTKKKILIPTL